MEIRSDSSQHQQQGLPVLIDACPWCGSQISHEEFLRIKEEIRAEEEAKLQEQRAKQQAELATAREAALREADQKIAQVAREHEKQLSLKEEESAAREAVLRQESQAAAKKQIADALLEKTQEIDQLKLQASARTETDEKKRQELERRIAELTQESQLTAKKMAALEQQEEKIRSEAKAEGRKESEGRLEEQAAKLEAAEEAAKATRSKFEAFQQKAAKDLENALAKSKNAHQTELLELRSALEKESDERLEERLKEQIAKLEAAEEATKTARTQLEAAQQGAAKDLENAIAESKSVHQKELLELRQVLEEDRDSQLRMQRAEQSQKNEKLELKLKELERQLHEKTADDGAEIDLFQTLCDEYPDDRITRIHEEKKRADIRFEVIDRGESIGKIILDSKIRQGWQNAYVNKLRDDQREEHADHAILSCIIFPSKQNQLCVQDGVIVANPRHVVWLVHLLRESMLELHRQRLSNEEREGKMHQLYELITSNSFRQLFTHAGEVARKLEDIDVKEQKAHAKVWKDRGTLNRSLQRAFGEVDREVRSILEGS